MGKKNLELLNHFMDRRQFLAAGAGIAALGVMSCKGDRSSSQEVEKLAFEQSGYGFSRWDDIFRTITGGFIVNALRTSDTFAVCDYPEGTMLKNFVTARGNTCDSVTRIMPAIAARIASPDSDKTIEVDGRSYDLREIFVSALANATDPDSKDYWLEPPPYQRQVESSIVAHSLWLVRDQLMDTFTSAQRKNIDNWLESCCRIRTVRGNNWALFTAVNQAARMALADRWSEFTFDEQYFRDDLAAVDKMYQGDGWYHDSLEGQEYDYYNFWVFASHSLYWDEMAGERFPDLRAKYRERLDKFLRTTPYFFAGNGSHVLWGRSLIYRWASLTPLVHSYRLGLWPLDIGLLRRICNRNLQFLWEAGAWDEKNLKLARNFHPAFEYCGFGELYQ